MFTLSKELRVSFYGLNDSILVWLKMSISHHLPLAVPLSRVVPATRKP